MEGNVFAGFGLDDASRVVQTPQLFAESGLKIQALPFLTKIASKIHGFA